MRTDRINVAVKKILGKGVKRILVKCLFPFRNKFILFNISNRVRKNRVNLNFWDESTNIGDLLSPIVVNYMLGLRGLNIDSSVPSTKHLYAVGSILTAGIQDATVWGSGVLNSIITDRLENRKLDIRAVRGPITRMILLDYGYDCPEIFGDPAILMPEIYTPSTVHVNKVEVGLILHKDYKINNKGVFDNVKSINICTTDYKSFIDQIIGCKMVVSSSLHGIILAESYGVPAVMLKPQVDFLKYYDYYYSTGRFNFPIAETIEEAVEIVPSVIPDFSVLRRNLHDCFPYDIFGDFGEIEDEGSNYGKN